jgi:hypothetical protein
MGESFLSDWKNDIEKAVDAFLTVAQLAGNSITRSELIIEYLPAPHHQPSKQPGGKMAVYCFGKDGEWLKIGQVGPNSNARYTSQHYSGSAMSTLAGSLTSDPRLSELKDIDKYMRSDWIKTNTYRVNILMSSDKPRELLSLLEAFLHLKLGPRYEG